MSIPFVVQLFIIAATLVSLIMGLIWSKNGYGNFLLKVLFFAIGGWGAILIAQLYKMV